MGLECSFCKKPREEVSQVVKGPDGVICNECADLASKIMREKDDLEEALDLGTPVDHEAWSPQNRVGGILADLAFELFRLQQEQGPLGEEARGPVLSCYREARLKLNSDTDIRARRVRYLRGMVQSIAKDLFRLTLSSSDFDEED